MTDGKKMHHTFPGLYLNSVGSPMGSPLSFFWMYSYRVENWVNEPK